MCGGWFGGVEGAVHSVPEAKADGWEGGQSALLNLRASMRAAVCTKNPEAGAGEREGSTNKKQQHLTAAKANALGKCLQGKAGPGPDPWLSESAAKALVHWAV